MYLAQEAEALYAQLGAGQQGSSNVGSAALEVGELRQHDGHVVCARQPYHLQHLRCSLVQAPYKTPNSLGPPNVPAIRMDESVLIYILCGKWFGDQWMSRALLDVGGAAAICAKRACSAAFMGCCSNILALARSDQIVPPCRQHRSTRICNRWLTILHSAASKRHGTGTAQLNILEDPHLERRLRPEQQLHFGRRCAGIGTLVTAGSFFFAGTGLGR